MAFGVVLYSPITPHSIFIEPAVGSSSLFVFPFASFAVVGGLIAIRKPQTPIGWLCLFGSLTLGLGALTSLVGTVLTVSNPGIGGWVLLASFLWSGPAAASLSVMVFAFLLFPDGHLPSPRWRWVARALVIVTAISAVLLLINPDQGLGIDSNGESILAIGGARGLVAALNTPVSVAGTVLGLAAVLSLFLRMRGATSERRHQIKWVAAAAALTIGILVLVLLLPLPPSLGWQALAIIAVLYVIAGVAVPTAIAIAVLKYRLYDIDVIINRAVVYGSLAVFITAVYVGIAVGIGTLVGSGGKPNLALSILATAIVAIGFQPVRERVQKIANRLVYGKRATPYEVLSEFSGRVAETYAADAVLPRMAQVLQEGTGAESATVWLRGMAELRPAATYPDSAAAQQPLPMNNGSLPAISEATQLVEVRHQGELLGAFSVNKRRGETLTPIEQKLVDDLANQAGLVLKNVGLSADLQARLDELRASRQRLVHAQDLERRRLERNLHDGAQQHLVALKVKLGLAEMLLSRDPAKAAATLEQLKGDADEALETLRDLARGIYPPLLADRGLVVAMESQARKATLPVSVEAVGIERYPQDVEATVYFCVLEALQNVQKYAAATHVVVRLDADAGTLSFDVTDDGAGFNTKTAKRGAGLTNMRDRMDALGGDVEVTSQPGDGTRVAGRLPVPTGATVAISA
ncbi:MAG: sensor histidine kinase [Candidatus Dormibacteria bacterium]